MAAIQFNARNGITVGVVQTPVIDASANGSLNSLALTTPLPAASGGLGSPITGLVKGSGSAYSAATIAVDYVSPSATSTFSAKQIFAAGSPTVTASFNIPNSSTGNTPVSGDFYGIGTGLQWHNGTAVKQIAYSDGTNSSGTWTINTSGTAANATLAAQATSLAGGTVGGIPYQSLVGTTSFLAIGTANQVLTSNGTNAPQWTSQSAMTVGNATNAALATASTNLAGGTAGAVPYQSGAGTTLFLSPGTAGYYLTSNGAAAPTWTSLSSVTVGIASNLASGVAGSIPYQTAANTTSFLALGTTNQVLTSNGTNAPQWTSQSAMTVGNATNATLATASTKLQTARAINGVYFDGSVDVNNPGDIFYDSSLGQTYTQRALGSDLNQNIQAGCYNFDNTFANRPAGITSWGFLQVFRHFNDVSGNVYVVQVAYDMNGNSPGVSYYRYGLPSTGFTATWSAWSRVGASSGGSFATFSSNGNFVVPPGVTTVYLTGYTPGGGGGSGHGQDGTSGSGGGGGGAGGIWFSSGPISVTPGTSIPVSVTGGAGGAGVSQGAGNAGSRGVLTFGALYSAYGGYGGGGGNPYPNQAISGAGGSNQYGIGQGGATTAEGQVGNTGVLGAGASGGAGSYSGAGGAGGTGGNSLQTLGGTGSAGATGQGGGGGGGASFLGFGGSGGAVNTSNAGGAGGVCAGGGGSGGNPTAGQASGAGGAGGNGILYISW